MPVTAKRVFSFLNIANRSLVETEYLLDIERELKFIDEKEYKRLEEQRSEIGIMLNAFTIAVRGKESEGRRIVKESKCQRVIEEKAI